MAGIRSQMRNVGEVRAAGLELAVSTRATSWMQLGGNFTLSDLKNVSAPATRLVDVPKRKLTAHATLAPWRGLALSAFAEHDSARWASNTLRLPGWTTLNVKAAYEAGTHFAVEAGVSNATDQNYSLAEGFPSAGRKWFANMRYRL